MSQKDKIKNLFTNSPYSWIPLYEIFKFAKQYNARIKELRESGMTILNKTKHVNGEVHSWFKYVPTDKSGQLQLL